MRQGAILLAFALLAALPAFPQEGGQVVQGGATITTPDDITTQIDQTTNRAIINWQGFSIDSGHLVRFNQPGVSSVILNRVVGADASLIQGALEANGSVFLLNPHGIVFGQGSRINVGSLVASTLSLGNDDFMNGNYHLIQDPSLPGGAVINRGAIEVQSSAALVAPLVENSGTISAPGGAVYILGTGEAILDMDGSGLIGYSIGTLSGTTIQVSPDALSDVVRAVVNTDGLVEAGEVVQNADGSVSLVAAGGTAVNSGTITTEGRDGGSIIINSNQASVLTVDSELLSDAGFVEFSTSGGFAFGGTVNTLSPTGEMGELLIDPSNITIIEDPAVGTVGIGGSGSDTDPFVTTTDGATLLDTDVEAALAVGNVTIQTVDIAGSVEEGDIFVDGVIDAPTGGGNLTLLAHDDIVLNADINFSLSTGDVTLHADWDSTTMGGVLDGAIIAGGGVIRMGGGALQLTAGSGIGTPSNPVLTTGVRDLSAGNYVGDLIISNSGSGDINIVEGFPLAGNPTGLQLRNFGGLIELTNTAGDITLSAPVFTTSVGGVPSLPTGSIGLISTVGSIHVNSDIVTGDFSAGLWGAPRNLGSGDISLSAAGSIAGSGRLITGNTQLDSQLAADTVFSGNITLVAGGEVLLSAVDALTTGDVTVLNPGAGDLARTGGISITAQSVMADTSGVPLDVSLGLQSAGVVGNPGTIDITTTGGIGTSGDILLASDARIIIGTLDTDDATSQFIDITGLIDLGGVWFASSSGSTPDSDTLVVNSFGNVLFSGPMTVGSLSVSATAPASFIHIVQDITTTNIDPLTSGDITLTSGGDIRFFGTIATGDVVVPDLAGMQTAASGDIRLTAAGSITGPGRLTTGNVQIDGASGSDEAITGSISLQAGGEIQLSAADALTTGDISILNYSADSARPGSIDILAAERVSSDGATGDLDVSLGRGLGIGTWAPFLSVTTHGGAGDAGGIFLTSDSPLSIDSLATDPFTSQNIGIHTTGPDGLLQFFGSSALDSDLVDASSDYFVVVSGQLDLGRFTSTSGSLTIISADVTTADAAASDSGAISITSASNIMLDGTLTTGIVDFAGVADSQVIRSGDITLSAAGSITGSGRLVSGNVTVNSSLGNNSGESGDLYLTAGSELHLSAVDALTTGDVTFVTPVGGDIARTGGISITAKSVMADATATPLDVSLGAQSAGVTGNPGVIDITTTGGAVTPGDILLTSDTWLILGTLDTDDTTSQNVEVTNSGINGVWFASSAGSNLDSDNVIVTSVGGVMFSGPMTLGTLEVAATDPLASINVVRDITTTAISPFATGHISLSAPGDIRISGIVRTGDLIANDLAGDQVAASGDISVTMGGDIWGSGRLVTGDVSYVGLSGNDRVTTGDLSLSAGGRIFMDSADALATGDITFTNPTLDLIEPGDITILDAESVSSDGFSGLLDVSLGRGIGVSYSTPFLSVTTHGGPGDGGGILVQSDEFLAIRSLDTDDASSQNVHLRTTGFTSGLLLSGISNLDSDAVTLTSDSLTSLGGSLQLQMGSLAISSAGGISISGDVATANTLDADSGGITLDASSHINLWGTLRTGNAVYTDLPGDEIARSGNITITTTGAIRGSGRLITGDAQIDAASGNDQPISGDIVLTAGGEIELSAPDALTTGDAVFANASPGDSSTIGKIILSGSRVAADSGTGRLGVLLGNLRLLSGGGVSNRLGEVQVSTHGGAGTAGGIFLTSSEELVLGPMDTSDLSSQTIIVESTGGARITWSAFPAVNLDTDSVTVTADGILTFAGSITLGSLHASSASAFPHSVALGGSISTTGGGLDSGAIVLTSAGGIDLSGFLTTGSTNVLGAPDGSSTSTGDIILTANNIIRGYSITRLTTGSARIDGVDVTAQSGSISLTAGDIFFERADALTTGMARVTGGSPGSLATSGDISLSNTYRVRSIDVDGDGIDEPLDLSIGIATADLGSTSAGVLNIQAVESPLGDAAIIAVTSGEGLIVGAVDTSDFVSDQIFLQTTGTASLTLSSPMTLDGDFLTLESAAGIAQTGGTLSAGTLQLNGTGDFLLTSANDVDVLSANVAGTLAFTDVDGLWLGDIGSAALTSAAITSGGALSQAAGATLIADQLAGHAADGISLPNLQVSDLQLTNTTSGVVIVVNAGDLSLGDLGGLGYSILNPGRPVTVTTSGALTLGGPVIGDPVSLNGGTGVGIFSDIVTSGSFSLTLPQGDLTVAADITVGPGETIDLAASQGDLVVNGPITMSGGPVSLTGVNVFDTGLTSEFPVTITATGGLLEITGVNTAPSWILTALEDPDPAIDSDDVRIYGDLIATAGTITVQAGDDIVINPAVSGGTIVSATGRIDLRASQGDIDDVGSISSSGQVVAPDLVAFAERGISLFSPNGLQVDAAQAVIGGSGPVSSPDGGINLMNVGNIELRVLDPTLSSYALMNPLMGVQVFSIGGSITVSDPVWGSLVTLRTTESGGATDDVLFYDDVTAFLSSISVRAADSIIIDPTVGGGSWISAATELILDASRSSSDGIGSVTQLGGSLSAPRLVASAQTGISLGEAGSLAVGVLQATNGLTAETGLLHPFPSGDIVIRNSGDLELGRPVPSFHPNAVDNRAPAGIVDVSSTGSMAVTAPVVTADVTTLESGRITLFSNGDLALNSSVSSGNVNAIDLPGDDVARSGMIIIQSFGSITGAGHVVTGDATLDALSGTDRAATGQINVFALGEVRLSAVDALATGSPDLVNGTAEDTAQAGSITISAEKISSDGGTGLMDISIATLPPGFGGSLGSLSVLTRGGPGDAGGVFVRSDSTLNVRGLNTDDASSQNLVFETTGGTGIRFWAVVDMDTDALSATSSGNISFVNGGFGTFNLGSLEAVSTLGGTIINTLPIMTAGGTGLASGDVTFSTSGAISVNSLIQTGDLNVPDTPGNQTVTTGSITLTAGTSVTGPGRLVTGNAQIDSLNGVDTLITGDITINAGGVLQLSGADALTTGDTTFTNFGSLDSGRPGSITISAERVAANFGPSLMDVSLGTGGGIRPQLNVTTHGGAGDAGGIFVTSDRMLSMGVLDTADGSSQNVVLETTAGGVLRLDEITDLDTDVVTLTSDGSLAIAREVQLGSLTATTTSGAALLVFGDVTTGVDATSLRSGDVTLNSSGSMTIDGTITTADVVVPDTPGNQAAASGTIDVTAAGSIIGFGRLVTGNVQIDGLNGDDTAASGDIRINAGGDLQMAATDALTTGDAAVTNSAPADESGAGSISIVAGNVSAVGTQAGLDVSLGQAEIGGLVDVTTHGNGPPINGNIHLTSDSSLTIGTLNTDDGTRQTISIETTAAGASLTLSGPASLDRDSLTLTSGGALTTLSTIDAGNLTATSGAGIALGSVTTAQLGTGISGDITLTSAGDLTVTGDVATGSVSAPDWAVAQTVTSGSITATAGGAISGTGRLITGDAQINAITLGDTLGTGSISLNAGGVVRLSGTDALTTGNAIVVGSASGGAFPGSITINAERVSADGGTQPLDVAMGMGIGIGTNITPISITTYGGPGDAGGVFLTTDDGNLYLGALDTADGTSQNLFFSTSGSGFLSFGAPGVDLDSDRVTLSAGQHLITGGSILLGELDATSADTAFLFGAITTAEVTAGSSGGLTFSAEGDILLDAVLTTGRADVLDVPGPQTTSTGDISLTAGGSITGSGRLVTGDAQMDVHQSEDSLSTGSIFLDAGGEIRLGAVDALTTGNTIALTNLSGSAFPGDVTILGAERVSADGGTQPLDVAFGRGIGISTGAPFFSGTTHGGPGDAGGMFVTTDDGHLFIGTLDTADDTGQNLLFEVTTPGGGRLHLGGTHQLDSDTLTLISSGNLELFSTLELGELSGVAAGRILLLNGSITTADVTSGTSGGITLTAGGSIDLDIVLTTGSAVAADQPGNQSPGSGDISLAAGELIVDDSTGLGRLVTGDVQVDGLSGDDTAVSGTISISAGTGILFLNNPDALTIGSAMVTNGSSGDVAIAGDIDIATNGPIGMDTNGDGVVDGFLDVSFGTASAGTGAATTGVLDIDASLNATGAPARIHVGSDEDLRLGNLETDPSTDDDVRIDVRGGAGLELWGVLSMPLDSVVLRSDGGVTQVGGQLTANALHLEGTGTFTLMSGTNDIQSLTANVGGALSFADATGLSLGDITVTGTLTLQTELVLEQAAGALVSAPALSGTAGEGIDLPNLQVDDLQLTNTLSGDVTVVDAGGLRLVDLDGLGYSISNPGRTVSVTTSGPLEILASIIAGTTNLSGVGDLSLNTPIVTSGSFVLTLASGNLNVNSDITVGPGQTIQLESTAGDLVVNGPVALSGGDAFLTGVDVIVNGGLTSTHSVTINATGGLVQITGVNMAPSWFITAAEDPDPALDTDDILLHGDLIATAGSITLLAGDDIVLDPAVSGGTTISATDRIDLRASQADVDEVGSVTLSSGIVTAPELIAFAERGIEISFGGLLQVSVIQAINTGSGTLSAPDGGIEIFTYAGDLQLRALDPLLSPNAILNTATGSNGRVRIISQRGGLEVVDPVRASSTITLHASESSSIPGPGQDLLVFNDVSSSAEAVVLGAADDLVLDPTANGGSEVSAATALILTASAGTDNDDIGSIRHQSGTLNAPMVVAHAERGINLGTSGILQTSRIQALNGGVAHNAPAGDIVIGNSGSLELGNYSTIHPTDSILNEAPGGDVVVSATGILTVSAPVATGDATGLRSGDITLSSGGDLILESIVRTGNVSHPDLAGDQSPESGSITLTSGGAIIGSGRVVTGDAQIDAATGTDRPTSGSIFLTANGEIQLSAANALAPGDAILANTSGDSFILGGIHLNATQISSDGAAGPLDLSLGQLVILSGSGAGGGNVGLHATTSFAPAGVAGNGDIFISSAESLSVAWFDTPEGSSQNVSVTAAGSLIFAGGFVDIDTDAATINGGAIQFLNPFSAGSLTATATSSLYVFGPITTTGDLSFIAGGRININGPVQTNGVFSGTATDPDGQFDVWSLGSIQVLASQAIIVADNVDLQGPVVTGGGFLVTIRPHDPARGTTLGAEVPGTLSLTEAELNLIDGALNIEGAFIAIEGPVVLPAFSSLELTAAGDITQGPGAPLQTGLLVLRAGGDISVTHPDNNVNNLALEIFGTGTLGAYTDADDFTVQALIVTDPSSTGADFTLKSRLGTITVPGPVDSAGGDVTLIANTGISLNTFLPITTTGGWFTADVRGPEGLFEMLSGSSIVTGWGRVNIYSDNVELAGSISTGGESLFIRPADPLRSITLGAEVPGTLSLTGDELNTSLSRIILSGYTAHFAGPVTLNPGLSLQVDTGGDITQAVLAPFQADSLFFRAGGSVTMTSANNVGILAVEYRQPGSSISFTNAGSLAINGIGGAFAVSPGVDVTVEVFSGTLAVTNGIFSQGGDVTLRASEFQIDAPVDAGAGRVTLVTSIAGGVLHLGSIGAPSELDNAELNRITAGVLQIGDLNTGVLRVVNPISLSSISTLSLVSAGNITDSGFGISVPNLAVRAGGDVSLDGPNAGDVLAAEVTGGGFSYVETDHVTIGSVDGLSGIQAAGNIGLSSAGGFDVLQDILSSAGGITIDSLPGTLSIIGSTVQSAFGYEIHLTADDILIQNSRVESPYPGNFLTATGSILIDNSSVVSGGDFGITAGTTLAILNNSWIRGGWQLPLTAGGDLTIDNSAVFGPFVSLNTNGNLAVSDSRLDSAGFGASDLQATAAGDILLRDSIFTAETGHSFQAGGSLLARNVTAFESQVALEGTDVTFEGVNSAPSWIAMAVTGPDPLAIGNDIRVHGDLTATSGSIQLFAEDNVVLDPAVTGGTTVSATSSINLAASEGDLDNVGAIVQVSGSLIAPNLIATAENGIDLPQIQVLALQALNTGDTPTGSIQVLNSGSVIVASFDGASPSLQNDGGTVNITTTDSLSLFDNALSAGDMSLTAGTGITVFGSIQTNGGWFTADVTGSEGLFEMAAGSSITTGGSQVTLTADNLDLNGSISSVSQRIYIQPADGARGVTLGAEVPGTLSLTDAELDTLAGGPVISGAFISIEGPVSYFSAGVISLFTSGDIVQSGTGSIQTNVLNLRAGGAVSLDSPGNSVNSLEILMSGSGSIQYAQDASLQIGGPGVEASFSSNGGVIDITSNGGTLTVFDPVLSNGGDVNLTAAARITLLSPVQTGGGSFAAEVTDSEGLFEMASGSSITTGGSQVSLIADNMDLNGSINSTPGRVLIQPADGARGVTLGAEVPGTLSLTDAELDTLAGGPVISGAFISIEGPVSYFSAGVISLFTSGDIVQSGTGSIQTNVLNLRAGGTVSLALPGNNVASLEALLSGTGSIQYAQDASLQIGGPGVESSFASNGGFIEVASRAGTLTVVDPVLSNGGDVNLTAAAGITLLSPVQTGGGTFTAEVTGSEGLFEMASGSSITTGGSQVTLTADNIDLNGAISSGSQRIYIQPADGARGVTLGAEVPGTLSLTDAELDTLAGGPVISGSSISFEGPVSYFSASVISLFTSGDIVQSGTGSIQTNVLNLRAGGTVSLALPGNNVASLEALLSGTGSIQYAQDASLQIGGPGVESSFGTSGGSIDVSSGTGSLTVVDPVLSNGGDVNLTAAAGITLLNSVQSNGGWFTSDVTGPEGLFEMATGSSIQTGGGRVNVFADNVELAGSISTGAESLFIRPNDALRSITLGSEVSGTLSLTGAELNTSFSRIILSGNTAHFAGPVTLNPGLSLQIDTAGDVTQSPLGSLQADSLFFRAGGSVNMTASGNNISAFAVEARQPGSSVDLTNTGPVDITGIGLIFSASPGIDVTVESLAGSVTVSGGIWSQGGDITLHGSDIDLKFIVDAGAGTLHLEAAEGTITQSASGFIQAGALVLDAGTTWLVHPSNDVASLTLVPSSLGFARGVIYTDRDTLDVNSIDTLGGYATIEVLSGTLTVTGMISTENGQVTLRANDIAIASGINTGSGTVTLTPWNGAGPLTLGGSAPGTFDLTAGELASIIAGRLEIGDGASGDVSIVGPLNLVDVMTLSITTGGQISQTPGATLSVAELAGWAANGISLGTLSVDRLQLTNTASGAIDVSNTGDLALEDFRGSGYSISNPTRPVTITTTGALATNAPVIGDPVTLNAGTGLDITSDIVSSGSVVLTAPTGDLTVSADITTGPGGTIDLSVPAGSLTIDGPSTLTSDGVITMTTGTTLTLNGPVDFLSNGDITLTSTDVLTLNGAITAGGGTVNLTGQDVIFNGSLTTADPVNVTATGGTISMIGNFTGSSFHLIALEDADPAVATDDISLSGTMIATGGAIVLEAGDDISIASGSLVRSDVDSLTLSAGVADNDGLGSISLAGDLDGAISISVDAIAGVSQSGGSITATDLVLTGTGAFGLGSATNDVTTLTAAVVGVLTLADASDLMVLSLDTTGGNTTLSANGLLTLSGDLTAGIVSLTAGGAVQADGVLIASELSLSGTGTFDLTASGNDVDTLTASVSGDLTFADANDLTVGAAGISTGAGDVSLTAASSANDNALTILAGSGITADDVTLTADHMTIDAPIASLGRVTLQPFEAGTIVRLGDSDGGSRLGLEAAEIDLVTADILVIGSLSSGDLQIRDDIAPAGTSTLSLLSGGQITQTDPLTVANLLLTSAERIRFDEKNNVGVLAARVMGAGYDFEFTNNGTLIVGTVDGTSGITALDGDVELTVKIADLLLTSDVLAGAGKAVFTVRNGSIVQQGGTLHAAEARLNAGLDIALPSTELGILRLESSIDGSLTVSNAGDLTIKRDVKADASVSISTSGALTVKDLVRAVGDIEIIAAGDILLGTMKTDATILVESTGGSIFDGNGTGNNLNSSGTATLRAAGTIGEGNALEVKMKNGTLNIEVLGETGGVSAELKGKVGTLILLNVPPGAVLLNGSPVP